MAKLSALTALNSVLQNIGESTVAALTSLTTLQLLCFNKLNEAIQEICTEENTRWQFLEKLGVVPMTTNNYKYTITALTSGSDLMREDKESFRQVDSKYKIHFRTPQEFDSLYPEGIGTDKTGYPDKYTKYAGEFIFNKQATTTQNGKDIDFRYWKLPSYYSTATAAGTSDFPEPFDLTVVVNLATMKVLAYLGSEEAANYGLFVYGDGKNLEGSLDKMRDIYASPELKPRMTYKF